MRRLHPPQRRIFFCFKKGHNFFLLFFKNYLQFGFYVINYEQFVREFLVRFCRLINVGVL